MKSFISIVVCLLCITSFSQPNFIAVAHLTNTSPLLNEKNQSFEKQLITVSNIKLILLIDGQTEDKILGFLKKKYSLGVGIMDVSRDKDWNTNKSDIFYVNRTKRRYGKYAPVPLISANTDEKFRLGTKLYIVPISKELLKLQFNILPSEEETMGSNLGWVYS